MDNNEYSRSPQGVTAEQAYRIANLIGLKDFKTAISRYTTGVSSQSPWIISVAHSTAIGRFAVLEASEDGTKAVLMRLSDRQASLDVVWNNFVPRGEVVSLHELLLGGFSGIYAIISQSIQPQVA
jgi:hypothetical protein